MAQLLIDMLMQDVSKSVGSVANVVACCQCEKTMWSINPQCFVHDDGKIYCQDCLPPSDEEMNAYRQKDSGRFRAAVRYAYIMSVYRDFYDDSVNDWSAYMGVIKGVMEECFPEKEMDVRF
jgi:hypothetical protein